MAGTAGQTSYTDQPPAPSWTSGYDVGSQNQGGSPYPGSNFVPNGDGTFTDTSTGIKYDANGTSLGNDPTYSGAMDQSGMPSFLQQLFGGGGGLGALPGIAGLLAPLLGGLYSANKTGQATSQVIGGINNASNIAKQLLGNTSAYAPYTGAGQQAISKLNGMNFTPMNFAPISQLPMLGPLGNRQLTLGNVAAAPTTVTRGK